MFLQIREQLQLAVQALHQFPYLKITSIKDTDQTGTLQDKKEGIGLRMG
jgi:hypothetical protein